MELVALFDSADPRGKHAVNLLLCLLGAIWLYGVKRECRFIREWRAWLCFWLATALYYLMAFIAVDQCPIGAKCVLRCTADACSSLPAFSSRMGPPWEQLGLYIATAALLWLNVSTGGKRLLRDFTIPILLVIVAAICDYFIFKRASVRYTGVHQLLTAVTIGFSAWRLRLRDQSKSAALLLYALVQLPVQPLLTLSEIDTGSYKGFTAGTGLAYAALKLAILPVVCFIASEDPRAKA